MSRPSFRSVLEYSESAETLVGVARGVGPPCGMWQLIFTVTVNYKDLDRAWYISHIVRIDNRSGARDCSTDN